MNRRRKINIAVQTGIVIGILLFLNLIGSRWFRRVDLTEDERFSVSEATVQMLDSLESGVVITVYFTGEMPTKYKYLEDGIRTFLIELSAYSNGNLNFQFKDPTGDKSIFQYFLSKGHQPFLLVDAKGTARKDVWVLPYAEINYKNGETRIVNLVKGAIFNNAEERKPDINIEKALQDLEYNLVSGIYSLVRPRSATVGFLAGHGEIPRQAMADLLPELNEYYNLVEVNLNRHRRLSPDELQVLVVMQPDTLLTEREKFELDQYLMRGGKIIFLLDHERIDFTIGEQLSTLTSLRNTNLDDFFLKMGLKVNYEIVEDTRCGMLDLSALSAGQGDAKTTKRWTFHPLIFPKGGHPVVRNVSDVLVRFGASIDTFFVSGVSHAPLLLSSPYTRRRPRVQFIDINQHVTAKPDERKYRDGQLIFGLTVKGKLRSLYEGRDIPLDSLSPRPDAEVLTRTATPGVEQVAVIADGEFATGEIIRGQLAPLPGDNKTLLLNLIDYFTGNEMLTRVRVRKVVSREINQDAVKGRETTIQAMNILLPVVIVIAYGILRQYLRNRRNRAHQLKDPQS